MKTWNKIHVDPTKRGNPNGGESEDTRLNQPEMPKSPESMELAHAP